jgi:class 3 adenylate cyclase
MDLPVKLRGLPDVPGSRPGQPAVTEGCAADAHRDAVAFSIDGSFDGNTFTVKLGITRRPSDTCGSTDLVGDHSACGAGEYFSSSGPRQANPMADGFWDGLDATQQQTFRSVAEERTFAAGATIMKEGDHANHVMVILSGRAKICVHEKGRERVIAVRGPGELVGERAALQVNERSATVTALETVKALVVKTEQFARFISAYPAVLDLVEGQVYHRLTEEPDNHGYDYCRVSTGSPPADRRTVADPDTPQTVHRRRRLSGEHCTVVFTDVVAFGARVRNDGDRLIVRQAILRMTQTALAGVWEQCICEDRGDGLLIVVPPNITTAEILEQLLQDLPAALQKHNRIHSAAVRIQLRLSINVGPVVTDGLGMSGEAIILAARLLDAPILKRSIGQNGASLGIIASAFVYETVIKHHEEEGNPASYQQVAVKVKETSVSVWMRLIGQLPRR